MKLIIATAFTIACISLGSCEEIPNKEYEILAHVQDDNNNPVMGAVIHATRYELIPDPRISLGKPIAVSEATDQNGVAKLSFLSIQIPEGVAISKEGYYSSSATTNWEPTFESPGKKTAQIKAILKPIKNPIPMYAHCYGNTRIRIPTTGVDYSYDLELNEFLPPHGKGKQADLIFHVTGVNDGRGKGRIRMTVRGNGDQTGFIGFITENRDRGSTLISDYLAPEKNYLNSLSFKFDSEDMKAAMNQPKDQNYYFRVRCQLNPDGSIKSCHYGKLYGPFTFWNIPVKQGGVASFGMQTSYFNPTPNDRNVEFDTKRNLIPEGNVRQP